MAQDLLAVEAHHDVGGAEHPVHLQIHQAVDAAQLAEQVVRRLEGLVWPLGDHSEAELGAAGAEDLAQPDALLAEGVGDLGAAAEAPGDDLPELLAALVGAPSRLQDDPHPGGVGGAEVLHRGQRPLGLTHLAEDGPHAVLALDEAGQLGDLGRGLLERRAGRQLEIEPHVAEAALRQEAALQGHGPQARAQQPQKRRRQEQERPPQRPHQ